MTMIYQCYWHSLVLLADIAQRGYSDWGCEVGIDGVNWEILKDAATKSAGYEAAFDFLARLL